jgi:putative ABC transport system permease protein
MWVLAIKAMIADRSRFLTVLGSIAFSVALINLQGGMLLGLLRKASMLADFGQAHVWVGHKNLTHVDLSQPIPERWIHRIRSVEGVERAEPYIISYEIAQLPNGKFNVVAIVGCESASLLGNAWTMAAGDARAVREPGTVLVDILDVPRLGNCRVGDYLEINGSRARVAGLTRGIVSFTTSPYVFTSLREARAKYCRIRPDTCSYFLVKARPGVDVADLCRRIQARVPDLDVLDRDSYSRKTILYWLLRTGLGLSFGLTVGLGLLIGLAVVGQTLYGFVTERLREFGTLKALGAPDSALARFPVAQTVAGVGLGSLLGLGISGVLAAALDSPRTPVPLTGGVALLSVALVAPVCLLASWVPYWRLRRIDPTSVLRA